MVELVIALCCIYSKSAADSLPPVVVSDLKPVQNCRSSRNITYELGNLMVVGTMLLATAARKPGKVG